MCYFDLAGDQIRQQLHELLAVLERPLLLIRTLIIHNAAVRNL
jgi:hypothetical protein